MADSKKRVELKKLILTTDKGNIEMTVPDAKALYEQLHELFGSKVTYIPGAPVIIERPWWQWSPRPVWVNDAPDTTKFYCANNVTLCCEETQTDG